MTSTINALPATKPLLTKDTNYKFTNWPAPEAAGGWVEIIINDERYTATVSASGTYSFELPGGWDDGMHVVQVVTVDPAGSRSTPSLFILNVDTKPPAAPKIMRVVDNENADQYLTPGDETADKTPHLVGSAEPGSLVNIYNGATIIGSARADKLGVWELDVTLANGTHNLTARATDATGNMGSASTAFTVKVTNATVFGSEDASDAEIAASYAETSESVNAAGGIAASLQKENFIRFTDIDGGGPKEAGGLVQIILDDIVYTTRINAEGTWSWSSGALDDGLHVVQARVLDSSLNWSPPTQVIYLIDAAAPEKPIIMNAFDDVGGNHNLSPGEFTNDNMPTFTGVAQPGSIVKFYDGGSLVIGSVRAEMDGTWSFTPTTGLSEGTHFISAEYTDSFDRVSQKSDAFKLEIDTNTPITPTIDNVEDDEGRTTGPISSGQPTDDKTPTFSGSAELGSIVRIWDGDILLGTAIVSRLGKWEFTPSPELNDGTYNIRVDAYSKGGNYSPSSPVFELIVDSSLMQPVEIGDVFADNVPGVTTLIPDDGVTNDSTPVITGVGNDGDIVYLYVDGSTTPAGSATVVDGKWSITPSPVLSEGERSLTVRAQDQSNGKWAPISQPRVIDIDLTAPDKPAPVVVIDDQGDATGPIPPGGTTDDKRPEFKGDDADEGDIVKVIVKDEDGNPVYIGSQVVGAGGDWSITPPTDLPDGEYEIIVVVTDPAGNESTESDPVNIIIDSQKPAPLDNIELYDDVGLKQGAILDGMSTDDTRPKFSGTGVNGTKVIIMVDGNEVARVDVRNGQWEYTPVTPLTEGPHTISAIPLSAAEVKGDETTPINFTVDTTAPISGTFEGVWYDAGQYGALPEAKITNGKTNDDTLILRGTAGENGTIVLVYGSNGTGELLGSTTVVDGAWEFRTAKLDEKIYNFHVVIEDAARNQLSVSTVHEIEVDTTPPPKPVIPGTFSVSELESLSDDEVTSLMSMSLNDILAQGEGNMFIDNGKAQLMVNGKEGDVLNISDILPEGAETASWQQAAGTVTVAGVEYNVYENASANAELLVQRDIETQH
jgi:hypothetical protein